MKILKNITAFTMVMTLLLVSAEARETKKVSNFTVSFAGKLWLFYVVFYSHLTGGGH